MDHTCLRHPCPLCNTLAENLEARLTGTARNVERTGQRYVSKLSMIARTVENVRHIDLDLMQYCQFCKKPQLFAEVKRRLVSDTEWAQTRMLARDYKCIGLLVIEAGDNIGVRIYTSADEEITEVIWGGEDYLARILERARDVHACPPVARPAGKPGLG